MPLVVLEFNYPDEILHLSAVTRTCVASARKFEVLLHLPTARLHNPVVMCVCEYVYA